MCMLPHHFQKVVKTFPSLLYNMCFLFLFFFEIFLYVSASPLLVIQKRKLPTSLLKSLFEFGIQLFSADTEQSSIWER